MIVDTAEESGRGVFADVLDEQMASAWVLVHESRHVVDESGYQDQGAFLGLFLD
jgi:hypothetical protein